MLRFATITLSNPARPGVTPVTSRVVVCDDDFTLSIGPGMAEKLQLAQTGLGDAVDIGVTAWLVPQMGPVSVALGRKRVTTHALVGPMGIVVGKRLAQELGIDASQQETRSATDIAANELLTTSSPDKIMIKENVLPLEICRQLCDYAAAQQPERATVIDVKKTTLSQVNSLLDLKSRDTFNIPIQGIEHQLKDIFFETFAKHVEPFFGVAIEWWEMPQMLLYEPGGKYDAHADADRWVPKADSGYWERNLDRDVSVLLYLNEHFTGGALNFPDHKITIQPKPGLLVAFPSSAKYRHGAEPTLTGERLVLVTWSKAKGTPRVRENIPSVIYMSSMRKEKL